MTHQTILLFDLPQMVGDVVEGVLADEGVEFVRASGDFVGTVAHVRPDVAVVRTDCADTALRSLLVDPPHVRLLVLDADQRRAALYDADPAEVTQLDITPDVLRRVLQTGEIAE